jgi:hypothetical protein
VERLRRDGKRAPNKSIRIQFQFCSNQSNLILNSKSIKWTEASFKQVTHILHKFHRIYDLEKPMGTLCTELHGKSKYSSRNSRYPKTNPPPEHIINEKYFRYPIGKIQKRLKRYIDWNNYIKIIIFLNYHSSTHILPTNYFLRWEPYKKSSHKS